MTTPTRRSTRATNSKKSYTVDLFEQYRDLLLQSDDDSRAPSPPSRNRDESSDDEFDANQAAADLAEAAAGNDDDSDEDEEDDVAQSSQDEEVFAPASESEGDAVVEVTPRTKPTPVKRGRPATNPTTKPSKRHAETGYDALPIFDPMGNTGAKGRNIHYTRGIPEILHSQSRESRLLYAVGPANEDLAAYIQAREIWLNDETAPYRKKYKGRPGGGLAYSPWYTEEKRKREVAEEMRWYHEEGGKPLFDKNQEQREVDADYAPNNYTTSDSIVAGPINAQELYKGPKLFEIWNLGDAYTGSTNADENQAWVFNAGARIQCVEWCPNRNGTTQYLAISTSQAPFDAPIIDDIVAPAFTPQAGRQQSLQIWEVFAQGTAGSIGSKIDFSRKPVLRQVISTDWGYVKKMRWCPTPDRADGQEHHLGLLGCIFSDGKLRVLDMARPQGEDDEAVYIHISKAAFESKPPETLFTCLTWHSSKTIAAGTADGSVAIWTLPEALKHDPSASSQDPRPWFYHRLHQAYIQALSSGYPSRPHILITYSFDGLLRTTDLRSPPCDTAVSQRSRISQGPVAWHDIAQSALNVDDNFTVKSYGVRQAHKAVSVARLTAFGADVSASLLHASVLVGCVDGSVWVSNPMRRLRDHKHKPLVQCVLRHEWRRPVEPAQQVPRDAEGSDAQMETADGEETRDPGLLAKPLIRLLTGFKIAQADMGQENRTNATKDYVSFATVYEDRTAVTQVSWNPNLRAGTWAGVGTGSGLVIVKDLAVD